MDETLYCIEAGEQLWSHDLPATDSFGGMTVLADETLLLATGSMLIQLSNGGREIGRVAFDFPLTCRPIMDEAGRIYIASEYWVRCLE